MEMFMYCGVCVGAVLAGVQYKGKAGSHWRTHRQHKFFGDGVSVLYDGSLPNWSDARTLHITPHLAVVLDTRSSMASCIQVTKSSKNKHISVMMTHPYLFETVHAFIEL